MKKTILNGLLATAFLSPFIFAHDASAHEYCREFTKTIRINGNVRTGYGTACQQQDGSWMIVNTDGDVDPFDNLREQNVVLVEPERPVPYYYVPVPVRYYSPGFYFGYGYGGRNHQDWNHRGHDDHDWNNGNGHGHH